ncbi:MAG: methyltransferase [Desulfobacterales bacterium]|nr:MAG: methyltransferase [Desulfobacterales bacterium]
MFSIETFYNNYEADTTELTVNGRKFSILLPKTLDRFINPDDIFQDFPLWTKIWQASWALAGYLADMPVNPQKRFLEIGAGVGVVSIVAATAGHHMTMTEYDSDALQFARANAHLNGLPQLSIMPLDWNRPGLKGRFDYIVGSEVIYREGSLQALGRLFQTYLKPEGEVILVSEMRKTIGAFFKQMEPIFKIQAQKKVLRSEGEKIRIVLFKLTFK